MSEAARLTYTETERLRSLSQGRGRKRRDAIHERDGWRCWYCGKVVAPQNCKTTPLIDKATQDHLVPLSKGGSDEDESNIVTACFSCNSRKGKKTVEEYRFYLRYVTDERGRWIVRLQQCLEAMPTPYDAIFQEAINWMEESIPPTVFHGEQRREARG